MSRINTNVTALISARVLNTNNSSLNKTLEKLSTGLRINRGADDPAGLIASENLRKQIAGTDAALKNAERASNIVGTAEGGLAEMSSMLLEVQTMLSEVANKGGMSTEEIDANQLQVDSIINSINRIANASEFEGIKLLNGNLGYTTSGVDSTKLSEITVNGAKLIDGAAMTVVVTRTTSAQTGLAYFSGTALSTSDMTIEIGSNRGTTELTFAAATTVANVRQSINAVKEITGISATLSTNSNTLKLASIDYGTDAYTSVSILSGQDDATNDKFVLNKDNASNNSSAKDYGVDAVATVNGSAATADGKRLTIRTGMLDAEFEMSATMAQAVSGGAGATETFYVTGGGADFALGSLVDAIGLESIGIQSVTAANLGNPTDGTLSTLKTGGTNSLSGNNLYTAQNIVNSAIKDISKMRGRLGAFQKNTLDTTMNSLEITKENLVAADSAIRDTDFATETSNLTRSQILVQAATSVLSQANAAPQNVLSLL